MRKTNPSGNFVYLLDTNIVELIFRGNPLVIARIRRTPVDQLWVSSLSVQEMLGGTIAEINAEMSKRRQGVSIPSAYLGKLVHNLHQFNILPYSDEAEQHYQGFGAATKRVGKMDCRIAAHAIIAQLTVITQNVGDFERIPGVVFEDWSKPPP